MKSEKTKTDEEIFDEINQINGEPVITALPDVDIVLECMHKARDEKEKEMMNTYYSGTKQSKAGVNNE